MTYFAFHSVWGKSPVGYYRVIVERKMVPRPIICFCNFSLSMESRRISSSVRGKSSLRLKICSRDAIATSIYLTEVMDCMGSSVTVVITSCGDLH